MGRKHKEKIKEAIIFYIRDINKQPSSKDDIRGYIFRRYPVKAPTSRGLDLMLHDMKSKGILEEDERGRYY